MEKTLEIINEMEKNGVIGRYAVGGGIAAIFYIEPVLTFDLDIFFIPAKETKGLTLLSEIYDYLGEKGYAGEKEHIVVEGVPVQFIPVYNELIRESVENAIEHEYKNVKTRIVRLEYLMAIMLQTSRSKDRERTVRFIKEAEIDNELLNIVLDKHGLKDRYESIRG